MDNEEYDENASVVSSASFHYNYNFNNKDTNAEYNLFRKNLESCLLPLTKKTVKNVEKTTNKLSNNITDDETKKEKFCDETEVPSIPYYEVNAETLMHIKDSTRKLLCLLDEIQSKIHSKTFIENEMTKFAKIVQPIPLVNAVPTVTDFIRANAIKKLEMQAKALDDIYIEDEHDDCSVYKRLTRKCHCLNQVEYNDFIIHFNEDTKYVTSTAGEVIKNLRILNKFLYMGHGYTKNALTFLNEGLSESSHSEKIEIIQGCAHADICNVFEEHSIVVICISWPCKYESFGDSVTQALAAGFLYKLSQLEEGRRYLNFSTKITNDLKRTIRKKGPKLQFDTLELLNATLNLLNPPLSHHINVTYYCRPVAEDLGNRTVNALSQYRDYMTLDEVFTHLDLLNNLSSRDNGKAELTQHIPRIIILFKQMLMEYDNSELNILITKILNNLVSKNIIKEKQSQLPTTMVYADTATEPIAMKNVMNQIPPKKKAKKLKSSKACLGIAPNRNRQPSKRAVNSTNWEPSNLINRSRKFIKGSVIVVPIENKLFMK